MSELTPAQDEAIRQIEICNACRYCEGYCAVFPAIFAERAFGSGDVTQFANLCHNCRGCYYACQYTPPHEFDLNLPAALAKVRSETWQTYAWPSGLARTFHRSGVAMAAALVVGIAIIFLLATAFEGEGQGFYAVLSHGLMVSVFLPAFVLPLLTLVVSLRRYWRAVDGRRLSMTQIRGAVEAALTMKNLNGGQGQGCNFENGDRYSNARRHAHQAVFWGFLLCFGSTASGTVLHYGFDMPAPYGLFSLPKLLGVPGGLLLVLGTAGLVRLKLKADRALGDVSVWGGEMAFVLLLGFTGLTGLALYAATGTGLVQPLLALHLGTVLSLFLTVPYSKMVHGFYRLAALLRDQQR